MKRKKGERGMGNEERGRGKRRKREEGKEGNGEWRWRTRRGVSLNAQPSTGNRGMGHGSLIFFTKR